MNRRTARAALESDLLHARDLARDLDFERVRARLRVLDLVRDHDRALARDLVHARALARALDLVRVRDLVRDRVRVRVRALALDPGLDPDVARARALALVRDLDRALDLALERLRELDQHPAATAGGQLMPDRMSRGLLVLAVRLLPAAQQTRYDAEFRGELIELRRRERWGYALRVLVGAWELRRALIGSVRTPDGDVAQRAER